MATTTPAQAFPVPQSTDDPDVVGDMTALALAIEKRIVGVYDNGSDLVAKVTSPQEGQVAYLRDNNFLFYYSGSAWVQFYPQAIPSFTSGSTVPSNSSGADGDVFFKV